MDGRMDECVKERTGVNECMMDGGIKSVVYMVIDGVPSALSFFTSVDE